MGNKFLVRGKQTCDDTWVYGYPYLDGKKIYIVYEGENDCIIHEVIPDTITRYIGLEDKNDKKIFKGDIIQSNKLLFVVKFGKCGGVQNVEYEVGYLYGTHRQGFM